MNSEPETVRDIEGADFKRAASYFCGGLPPIAASNCSLFEQCKAR
jgi:hypothetical protein